MTPAEVKAMGFARMAGVYDAQGYQKGYGNCRLHLELKEAQGLFRGDTKFACFDMEKNKNGDPIEMMAEKSAFISDPDQAILAGKVENDTIHLKAKKNVGKQWCAITDLTLTPGETGELIAEWTNCGGGHLNLQRSPR